MILSMGTPFRMAMYVPPCVTLVLPAPPSGPVAAGSTVIVVVVPFCLIMYCCAVADPLTGIS